MLSVIAFFLHFGLLPANSAPQASVQVPFFKSSQSLFPSGYTSLEFLQKQQVQKFVISDTAFRWKGQNFRKNEIRPVLPVHLSQFVIDIATQQRWKVVESGIETLKVENPKSKSILQMATNEVISDATDLGYALTLKDVYLKSSAQNDGKILTTIAQGYRLKPLEFINGFFKVHYKDYVGFVSLSEALTKFDLSTMVFAAGKWHFVKRREFDNIITSEDIKISMNSVQKLMTPDTRGIIASATQKIPLWSQVEVVKYSRPDWLQSQLKGHGPIWWRQPSEDSLNSGNEKTVLIDELIRQPISSVSFHPKNPLKGILSSNGVYVTEDGLHWKNLKQFEKFNGPVHYFNDLLIFVGNFRSVTGGRTFENYIQIDKLASAIEAQYGFLPKRLQVRKIETRAPFRLKIEIETGYRKIQMESPLFSQDWTAVKI